MDGFALPIGMAVDMLSEKANRILRRIGSFTEEQLATMTEAQAWNHIYAHDSKPNIARSRVPEVCFTGFTDDAKCFLAEKAVQAGLTVKDSVTKTLKILVAGSNAGPRKLAKAAAQKCVITDAAGFLAYIEQKK
jgi:NAD-dependent DNA ligase